MSAEFRPFGIPDQSFRALGLSSSDRRRCNLPKLGPYSSGADVAANMQRRGEREGKREEDCMRDGGGRQKEPGVEG